MTKKKHYKVLKFVAGFTAISCSLHTYSIHADDDLYMMNEIARDYWLLGKAGEGLCGARMQPDIDVMKEEANKGNTITAHKLGQLYEDGIWGVQQNSVEAIKWYELAAKGGVYSAIINLGTIYEYGRGATKDLSKAKYWFMEAQKITHDDYLAEKIIRIQKELKN